MDRDLHFKTGVSKDQWVVPRDYSVISTSFRHPCTLLLLLSLDTGLLKYSKANIS